jgi:hypothetical protein
MGDTVKVAWRGARAGLAEIVVLMATRVLLLIPSLGQIIAE